MLAILEKHVGLAQVLLNPSEAEQVKAGEALRQTIAELQDTKTSLRESQQLSRWHAAIVRSSDDAIISKNLDGIITSWNNGAERIFGYQPAEVIGKPITILIPSDRYDEEDLILGRIRRGERVDHFEPFAGARMEA